MDSFWAGVGAMAGVGVLAIAWFQYRATITGLVARVQAHQFELPSYLADGPSLIARRLSWPEFISEIEGVSAETKSVISNRIRQQLDEIFPRDAQLWGELFRAYWTVEMRNEGRNTAEEVALRVPRAKRVRVVREGKDPIERDVSVLIELGSIRPGETVAVQVWAEGFYSGDQRSVQLVQKSGRAKVIILESVSPFWKWISNNWAPLIFGLLWLVLIGLLTVASK